MAINKKRQLKINPGFEIKFRHPEGEDGIKTIEIYSLLDRDKTLRLLHNLMAVLAVKEETGMADEDEDEDDEKETGEPSSPVEKGNEEAPKEIEAAPASNAEVCAMPLGVIGPDDTPYSNSMAQASFPISTKDAFQRLLSDSSPFFRQHKESLKVSEIDMEA